MASDRPNNNRARLDWDKHDAEILDLFVTQNKTLSEVMKHMKERHSFEATSVSKIYAHSIVTD